MKTICKQEQGKEEAEMEGEEDKICTEGQNFMHSLQEGWTR